MRARFTDTLRALADPVWRAQHDHPFVRGIGDGTLEVERFKHWVRQDYRFLIEYCRLFGLAAARAPDLPTLARFADLLQATARTEMDLHRAYARELGISEAELEAEPMAPTTRGYTDFLLRVAATGDFAELVAALLPCMWGFSAIGQTLGARGLPAERPATTTFDRTVKAQRYAASGVPHYWIVDPDTRALECFRREGTAYLLMGSFGPEGPLTCDDFPGLRLDLAALWR
jgi:thiaminase II